MKRIHVAGIAALLVGVLPFSLPGVSSQGVDRQQQLRERIALAAKVREASKKGIEYLKRVQSNNGLWYFMDPKTLNSPGLAYEQNLGTTALCALALHESDRNNLHSTKPHVDKAAAFIRRDAPRSRYTYTIALSLIFLDRYYRQDIPHAEINLLAQRLVKGQSPSGGWGYECHQAAVELDNSNTHFAVLALLLAKRRGAQVDQALKLSEKRFRETQQTDGGWNYSSLPIFPPQSTPPMTCAGLLGLSFNYRHVLRQKEVAMKGSDTSKVQANEKIEKLDQKLEEILQDPQIARARDFLVNRITLISKDYDHVTYFLWSFERIAFIFGDSFFGNLDWFKLGCDILLPIQHETEGYWSQDSRQGARVDTSFALLFLNRVNLFDEPIKEVSMVSGPMEKTAPMVSGKSGAQATSPQANQDMDKQEKLAQIGNKQEADKLAKELEMAIGPRLTEILDRMVQASDPAYAEAMARAIAKSNRFVLQERVRQALIKKMGLLSPLELRNYLNHRDRELRLAAVEAVAHKLPSEQTEYIGEIISRLDDQEAMVRTAAHVLLKKYSKQDWELDATRWKKWWETAGPAKTDG